MQATEAMQHGLGYAAGREDASGEKTAALPDHVGFIAFATAYARGWSRYNAETMHFMVSARDGYDAWQASNGQTIYRLAEQSEYTLRCLARDGDVPAGQELAERQRVARIISGL
jgi:hypothetical protein